MTKITLRLTIFVLALIWAWINTIASSNSNEQLTGRIYGFNHTKETEIKWFTINGYTGYNFKKGTCCEIIPLEWSSGYQMVFIEWIVDKNPYELDNFKIKNQPKLENKEFRYQYNTKVLIIPKYNNPCDIDVHFLPCKHVIIIPSCYKLMNPQFPMFEVSDMEDACK